MAETIFGLVLLWIASGMLAWPLLGGVWLRDDLGAPDWSMKLLAVVMGPLGFLSAVIFWLFSWPRNRLATPRVAWLYGVEPGEQASKWYPVMFAVLVFQIALTGVLYAERHDAAWIAAIGAVFQIAMVFLRRRRNREERGQAAKLAALVQVVSAPLYQIQPPPPAPAIDRDPEFDDTMGYRNWSLLPMEGVLRSPVQGTLWFEAELHCEDWCESDVVRGRQGIHAGFVPVGWRNMVCVRSGEITIAGIVERFGKYVLGTDGWRAEWVVIRKLIAPNAFIAAGLRGVYPDIEIIIAGE